MPASQRGFTLIELMVVLVIFLVVVGAIFGLLNAAQHRYRAEQQFLESFQNARVGMDQLVREIRSAGLPSPYTFPGPLGFVPPTYPGTWPTWVNPFMAAPDEQRRFAIAFPGVPAPNCGVGVDCTVPSPTSLRMELDIDPENTACPSQVEVIDYQLQDPAPDGSSTLMRRVRSKPGNPAFASPPCISQGNGFVPFVENVLPNPDGVPLFQYVCKPSVPVCTPQFIRDVILTLTVRSPRRDPQTQQFRQITLQSAVRRLNPYE